jgi:hypothetical protein
MRDRLPDVPIPLAEDVADTLLPIRACLDRAYDEGTYDLDFDYEQPLTPRPSKQDVAWIRKLLKTQASESK